MAHDTEETPLLQPNGANGTGPQISSDNDKDAKPVKGRRSQLFILTTLFLLIAFLETGDQLIQPAQTRVVESIYCRQYYELHDPSLVQAVLDARERNAGGSETFNGIPEHLCKNHVIQGQVAMLKGWLNTIEALVMLLVSVPWGYMGDRFGRKPVVLTILISLWFRAAWMEFVCYLGGSIDVRWIWAAALTDFVGGGSAIASAMAFTILADVVPEVDRAATFFRVGAASMSSQVIGPGLGAFLMKRSPWIPMLLGLVLQFLCILLIIPLPETKGYKSDPSVETDEAASSASSSTSSDKTSPLSRLIKAGQDSLTFLASDIRLLLCIPAFLVHMLFANRDILLQYISTRYALTLSRATYLLTLRSAFIFLFLLVLFPTASRLLRTTWRFHPQKSDLILSRTSALMQALGFFLIALAPNIPLLVVAVIINTFGAGVHLFLRSLATSLVEAHHVARLNTFVSWFDMVGLMVGSPTLAWLFERGVDAGGYWTGLPFLACAGGMAVIVVLLGMISLGHPEISAEEEQVLLGAGRAEGDEGV